jgi:hypothetical protein
MNADYINVLEKGKVKEKGKFEELEIFKGIQVDDDATEGIKTFLTQNIKYYY